MKRFLSPLSKLGAGIAIVLALSAAARADVLLATDSTINRNLLVTNINDSIAASFTTDSIPRVFTSCTLQIGRLGNPVRNAVITLAADNGGVPGATVAALGTATLNGPVGFLINTSVSFDPIILPPGTTFWLVIHPAENGTGGSDQVGWEIGFNGLDGFYLSGPYAGAGGVTKTSTGGHAYVNQPTDVAVFELDGLNQTFPPSPPPPPVPPSPVFKGDAVPFIAGATYTTLFSSAINSQQERVYRASIAIPPSHSATILGRYLQQGGEQLVAQSGTTAPGFAEVYQSCGEPIINEDGQIAFTGTLHHDSNIGASNDACVWTDLGGMQPVWQKGTQAVGAPDGQLFVKATWINLTRGALYIGATAQDATVLPHANSAGVWKWDGGALNPVVVTGQTVAGYESHGTVSTIGSPVSSGNGNATSRLVSRTGEISLLLKFSDKSTAVVPFGTP